VDGRAAERFDHEGWLDTGDLGMLDEDGYLYLAGRADDVINRGGELVYPREIEEVLMGDHRVLDAIAVGRPDDILGQTPVAYVIARERPRTDADAQQLHRDLEALCTRELSRFKRPAQLLLVDELPRAPMSGTLWPTVAVPTPGWGPACRADIERASIAGASAPRSGTSGR
jgi:acyl-CoA synthetase (AMP-forming)/AMP-acid ligase II